MTQAKPISRASLPPMPNTMPVEPEPTKDMIHNPSHYTSHPTGVECKDIVQEFTYNIGVAMSYLWRAPFKHDSAIEDLQKAQKHIGFEIERLQSKK